MNNLVITVEKNKFLNGFSNVENGNYRLHICLLKSGCDGIFSSFPDQLFPNLKFTIQFDRVKCCLCS
jgi:hypothetical protein